MTPRECPLFRSKFHDLQTLLDDDSRGVRCTLRTRLPDEHTRCLVLFAAFTCCNRERFAVPLGHDM